MVRDYHVNDLPGLVNVFNRAVREIAVRDYSDEQLNAWAPNSPDFLQWSQRLSNEKGFVYETDNYVVGFVADESDGHLDLLYVHPEYQRRGIARALFEAVVEWARSRSLTRLFTEASVTAKPFFERCGFTVVREQMVEVCGVAMRNFQMERACAA